MTHLDSFPQNDTQALAHIPWEKSCSLPPSWKMWGRGAAGGDAGGCGAEVLPGGDAPGAGRALPRPNSATQWQHPDCFTPPQRRGHKSPRDAARKRVRGYSFKEPRSSWRAAVFIQPTAEGLWQQHRFNVSFPPVYFQPRSVWCHGPTSSRELHHCRQPEYKHLSCQSQQCLNPGSQLPLPVCHRYSDRVASLRSEQLRFPGATISNR